MSDPITKALDKLEENLAVNNAVISDRLLKLEQQATDKGYGFEATTKGRTLGALVTEQFLKNEESFKRHKTLSLEISTKSIGSTAVGARSSISPTPGGDVQVVTQLLPKLPTKSAQGVASLIYARRSTTLLGTGATAVGENVSRPQSEPVYASITQGLCTVAGHAVLSETALRTTGELQNVIDLHLQADVYRAADVLLIAGGTNFAGGMLSLATADIVPFAGSNDLLEETIAIGAMSMRAAGYQPDIVVVNPVDWRSVYLRREAGGLYVHSSPLAQTPLLISGCAVVFSTAITTKQAMLIDSRYSDFMPSEAVRVEMAYTGTQFLTGEITIRAELQGIPVVRDSGAIKLMSRATS